MKKYINEILNLADQAFKEKEIPIGAIVVLNDEIIGRGYNKRVQTNDVTSHAEVNAIREASKNVGSYDLSGCEIYTTCYPCPMCLSAIIWANIKKVYYGNTKEDAASIGFRDDMIYDYIKNNGNLLDLENIDREETIKTFEEFNSKEDKTIY